MVVRAPESSEMGDPPPAAGSGASPESLDMVFEDVEEMDLNLVEVEVSSRNMGLGTAPSPEQVQQQAPALSNRNPSIEQSSPERTFTPTVQPTDVDASRTTPVINISTSISGPEVAATTPTAVVEPAASPRCGAEDLLEWSAGLGEDGDKAASVVQSRYRNKKKNQNEPDATSGPGGAPTSTPLVLDLEQVEPEPAASKGSAVIAPTTTGQINVEQDEEMLGAAFFLSPTGTTTGVLLSQAPATTPSTPSPPRFLASENTIGRGDAATANQQVLASDPQMTSDLQDWSQALGEKGDDAARSIQKRYRDKSRVDEAPVEANGNASAESLAPTGGDAGTAPSQTLASAFAELEAAGASTAKPAAGTKIPSIQTENLLRELEAGLEDTSPLGDVDMAVLERKISGVAPETAGLVEQAVPAPPARLAELPRATANTPLREDSGFVEQPSTLQEPRTPRAPMTPRTVQLVPTAPPRPLVPAIPRWTTFQDHASTKTTGALYTPRDRLARRRVYANRLRSDMFSDLKAGGNRVQPVSRDFLLRPRFSVEARSPMVPQWTPPVLRNYHGGGYAPTAPTTPPAAAVPAFRSRRSMLTSGGEQPEPRSQRGMTSSSSPRPDNLVLVRDNVMVADTRAHAAALRMNVQINTEFDKNSRPIPIGNNPWMVYSTPRRNYATTASSESPTRSLSPRATRTSADRARDREDEQLKAEKAKVFTRRMRQEQRLLLQRQQLVLPPLPRPPLASAVVILDTKPGYTVAATAVPASARGASSSLAGRPASPSARHRPASANRGRVFKVASRFEWNPQRPDEEGVILVDLQEPAENVEILQVINS
ncbi:unnamed protein product [Amoebophrya sp. A120]|nr:unnamed protein product [Amoebophrya sp. A120]|eukprot:GSA120T00006410001.1